MSYILGQIFGIIALIASVIMPLYKKKWQMLVNNIIINLAMALNFILIGEIGSAAALCIVAVVQCIVSLIHTLRDTKPSTAEIAIFFLLYLGFGFFGLFSAPSFVWELSGHNLLELLPIVGSICSMTFVFIRSEQLSRWVLLATCSIWSVYTALIGAASFFAQFFTLISTIFAMYKYRAKKPSSK